MGSYLLQPHLSPGPSSTPSLSSRPRGTNGSPVLPAQRCCTILLGPLNSGHTLILPPFITCPLGHPRLSCYLFPAVTQMDANSLLLLNPSCHLLPVFSPLTPPHPSAHTHPPIPGPDLLPSQTGSSIRDRPCLDLPGPLAQSTALSQLSGAVKVSLSESGQWGSKIVASMPASQVCLQHCLGCSKKSTLVLSLPLHGHPVRAPAALLLGGWSLTTGCCQAPAPPIPQHLSTLPELTDGRAPLLLAPVQAAW